MANSYKEWICLGCNRVFHSSNPKCCGEVEEFDVAKHGRLLIPTSNAWIIVWKAFENNTLRKQVAGELIEDGCFSSAAVLIEFIHRLMSKDDCE